MLKKKVKKYAVAAMLLFWLAPHILEATTYYITARGSDTASGASPEESWASISKVNSSIFKAGDSILFEGGVTFQGGLFFKEAVKGSPGAPIVISSFGNRRAVISSGDSSGFKAYNTAGIQIRNLIFRGSGRAVNKSSGVEFFMDLPSTRLRYIHIEGVEVEGYQHSGILIGSWSGSSGFDDVTIRHVLVHDNGEAGISTYAEAGFAHRNVYIGYTKAYNISGLAYKTDHHSGSGIVVSGVDGALIEYCEAYNNGWLNAWEMGGPVGIWGFQCNNLVIQYNESHHNRSGTARDGGGFDIDGGCTNCVMQYNYSHNNDGPGYLIAQYAGAAEMKAVTVRFNISQNDARNGKHGAIHLWSTGSSGGIQDAQIYNNTVYLAPSSTGNPRAVYVQSAGVQQASFRNNIFLTSGGVELVAMDRPTNLRFEGNNYWSSEERFIIHWGDTTFTSLEDWRLATKQEELEGAPTGHVLNPMLKQAGKAETISNPDKINSLKAYQLRAASPLKGKGLNLEKLFGISMGERDFWGNEIPEEPSIGAHQPAPR